MFYVTFEYIEINFSPNICKYFKIWISSKTLHHHIVSFLVEESVWLLCTTLLILVPTALLRDIDNWSYVTFCYFAVVTLSTMDWKTIRQVKIQTFTETEIKIFSVVYEYMIVESVQCTYNCNVSKRDELSIHGKYNVEKTLLIKNKDAFTRTRESEQFFIIKSGRIKGSVDHILHEVVY